MSKKGTKRTGKHVGESISQKKLRNINRHDNSLQKKASQSHVKDEIRLVNPLTKLSDYASHAYEHHGNDTSSAEKERPHHHDQDSDEDVASLLSSHGNKKMLPFYHPFKEEMRMIQSPIFRRQIL